MTDWTAVCRRNARSVQTIVGWIFWDPGAIERYTALGVPGPLGYVPARAAPLAPAGDDAVIAAFSTIHPDAIRVSLAQAREHTTFDALWAARNDAVVAGLHRYVPDQVDAIAAMAPWLWDAVAACPLSGRALFGACRSQPRPDDPLLSAWLAVNCLREWRGDTHMAVLVEADLGPVEASLLHSAWVGYPHDWVARSRMWGDAEIAAGFEELSRRGLAELRPSGDDPDDGPVVTEAGIELRHRIERRTDELTATPWRAVGHDRATHFADVLEPPCETLLARVDTTAGDRYQPASRLHPRSGG